MADKKEQPAPSTKTRDTEEFREAVLKREIGDNVFGITVTNTRPAPAKPDNDGGGGKDDK